MGLKTKITKFITGLLIISFIVPASFFYKPEVAEAQWYTFSISDFWNALTSGSSTATAGSSAARLAVAVKAAAKEVYKETKMAIARKAIQEVTKSTINWINTGFHGNPLFIENPESLFEDIAKTQIKNLVNTIGYDSVKYPFGKDFALYVIDSYNSQLEDNAAYTLRNALQDRVQENKYQNNFISWNNFLVHSQFPQNNYIGFQIEASTQLAHEVRGTALPASETVKSALNQGMGFFSPKKCPADINPNYNNGFNEFKRPNFDGAQWEKDHPYETDEYYDILKSPACVNNPQGDLCLKMLDGYDQMYRDQYTQARIEWNKTNNCMTPDGKSGLVSTTPGSVVAHQIMSAIDSNYDQRELAAALGNSLSAILDTFINKMFQDGVTALTSKINPPPRNEDNWSYDGLTLGSGEGGVNTTWDSGPEVPIVLEDFKKLLDDAIKYTTQEIQITDSILSHMGLIWPEARKLDVCLPGPDLGWQERLQNEVLRNSRKLQQLQAEDKGKTSEEATLALKEFKFASDFFRDWINNKMLTELPGSVFYMDSIDSIKAMPQRATELLDAKKTKTQALARLSAIRTALNTIASAPPGSAQEKTLILLKRQYDGVASDASSFASLSERQNELDIAKDGLKNIKELQPKCEDERKSKGWGVPGGPISSFSGGTVTSANPATASAVSGIPLNSEQAIFCSLPIIGGYTHEMFRNETGVTHPEIPMVNAKKVMTYRVTNIKSVLSTPGLFRDHSTAAYVNIQLSCNSIFNAKLLDYKGNMPGLTTVVEDSDALPDDTGGGVRTGKCTYEADIEDDGVTEENCDLNGGEWTPDPEEGEGN